MLGRRVRAAQVREGGLERHQLAELRVVFRVGQDRRVVEVVGAVGGSDLGRQDPVTRGRARRVEGRGSGNETGIDGQVGRRH